MGWSGNCAHRRSCVNIGMLPAWVAWCFLLVVSEGMPLRCVPRVVVLVRGVAVLARRRRRRLLPLLLLLLLLLLVLALHLVPLLLCLLGLLHRGEGLQPPSLCCRWRGAYIAICVVIRQR